MKNFVGYMVSNSYMINSSACRMLYSQLGMLDGENDGFVDGVAEGSLLGILDGSALGIEDGSIEGELLGLLLGAAEGNSLG
jgi:hypothetical protein